MPQIGNLDGIAMNIYEENSTRYILFRS